MLALGLHRLERRLKFSLAIARLLWDGSLGHHWLGFSVQNPGRHGHVGLEFICHHGGALQRVGALANLKFNLQVRGGKVGLVRPGYLNAITLLL
jgi:hypothetical protein